jgi:tRNA threonylcarbamoyladenosine biosynthesis protein TsaE
MIIMQSRTHESMSEDQTRGIARELASGLRGGSVVALDGDLGAGKTRFVQGLAEGLGIDPSEVASPTFVLSQEHRAPSGLMLVHVDAYRLTGSESLESIGGEDFIRDPKSIVAVEWASRVEDAIPRHAIRVRIEHGPESVRVIHVSRPEAGRKAACPICGAEVSTNAETSPFCSARCRMADLNRWFTGAYSITRPLEPEEE